MGKESFNRIIDALDVRYILASRRKVLAPVELQNTKEPKDVLVFIEKGHFTADPSYERIAEGSFYLVPCGNAVHFRHGKSTDTIIKTEGFSSKEERAKYFCPLMAEEPVKEEDDVFSIYGFEVLIHGAIPFFSIIDLPCLRIEKNNQMCELLCRMLKEEDGESIGKTTILNQMAVELVVYICRYIQNNPELESNIQKLKFLNDKRLISIIQYIQENLDQDLTNHSIASLAYVSKDYVGQFFKSLTNHNLQDYIENRRLGKAHQLLRTTNDSIQEISLKVGFKDPAYFSRRFKMRFGFNANSIRNQYSPLV